MQDRCGFALPIRLRDVRLYLEKLSKFSWYSRTQPLRLLPGTPQALGYARKVLVVQDWSPDAAVTRQG